MSPLSGGRKSRTYSDPTRALGVVMLALIFVISAIAGYFIAGGTV